MSTLLELAERCEAATGPDREIDEAIVLTALGWKRADYKRGGSTIRAWDNGEYRQERTPDFYTASLDAAMQLVPEGFDWAIGYDGLAADDLPCGNWAWCRNEYQPHDYADDLIVAATPALALCAAALRARAHTTPPSIREQ
jgi:hypothetical protein